MPAAALALESVTVNNSTPDVPSGATVIWGVSLTTSRWTPATFKAAAMCDGPVTIAFAVSATASASVPEVGAGPSNWTRVDPLYIGISNRWYTDTAPATAMTQARITTQWPSTTRRVTSCRSMFSGWR